MTLRAIVIGTGWAGEGHTLALQAAGVEVMALCGRTAEPARAMAEKLRVAEVRFGWRQALGEFQPDIVAIATPADPHHAMAITAVEAGCHVVCEKPLAVNAVQAREMLRAVEQAGVKHAYAATGCYAPLFRYARTLLADGLIGMLHEIDYLVHDFSLSPLVPYTWAHRLETGGGFLNNVFTHHLQQVLMMTGGSIQAAMGTVTRHFDRAPVGPPVHDFRQAFAALFTPEQAATAEWRTIDADLGYALQVQLRLPDHQLVLARFTKPEDTHYPYPNHLAFHGSTGTLYLAETSGSWTIQHFDATRGGWADVAMPPTDTGALSLGEDPVQQQWNDFFHEFVLDIQGEGYAGYPTFRDGWVAVEVMEVVRSGRSWTSVLDS